MSMNSTVRNADCLPVIIRFNLPEHKIDSRTLGTVLIETTRLIERVGRSIDPDVDVNVEVSVPQSGSFEIPVTVYAVGALLLTNIGTLAPYLQKLMDTATAFIKLKQFLKGKDPIATQTNENRVTITGDNNIVTIVEKAVLNFYKTDPEAHRAVETQFKQLAQDPDIETFEILADDRRVLTQIAKSDFPAAYAPRRESDATATTTVHHKEDTLIITQPLLQNRTGNWKFLDAEGQPLVARMTDSTFLKNVAEGEQFAMGDRLRVELEVEREYDQTLRAHKIKQRSILRVLKHFKRNEQMMLPDGNV